MEDEEFQIGDQALCQWGHDQIWHVCELIETRIQPSAPEDDHPMDGNGKNDQGQQQQKKKKEKKEFYIHFLQLDRRNDQWIPETELRRITPDVLRMIAGTGKPVVGLQPQHIPGGVQQLQTPLSSHTGDGAGAALGVGGGMSLSEQQSQSQPLVQIPSLGQDGQLVLSPVPSSSSSLPGGGGGNGGGAFGGGTPLLRSSNSSSSSSAASRRARKRKFGDIAPPSEPEPLDPADAALEKEHEERTKIKNIDVVSIGQYDVDCWYYSPYPEGYRQLPKIYVCGFCLRYMRKPKTMLKHKQECKVRHPPGDEIYRDGNIAVFEVDGGAQPIYSQCLCLLAKLFIDHKTLYYDVEPFLFYILTEVDEEGHHVVGYFSKEKHSPEGYNLACILTFPQYQRRGYGRFLIELSYALSRMEGTVGSPEKPLSDLGRISYRSYWTRAILQALAELPPDAGVEEVALHTGIRSEDVISTLKYLGLIRYVRGDHIIVYTPKLIAQLQERLPPVRPDALRLKPEKLIWTKPVFRKRKHSSSNSSTDSSSTAGNHHLQQNNNPSSSSSSSSNSSTTGGAAAGSGGGGVGKGRRRSSSGRGRKK